MVAGTNYKLLLDIANSQNKKERLEAVVYGEVLCKPTGILKRPGAALDVLLSVLSALHILRRPWLCAEPLGGQEMKLTSSRTPSPDEVQIAFSMSLQNAIALALSAVNKPHVCMEVSIYQFAHCRWRRGACCMSRCLIGSCEEIPQTCLSQWCMLAQRMLSGLGTQAAQSAEQHSERMSGGLLGGYKEVSTSDQEVTEAASFAAEQLSQRSNSLYPFKVKEVRLCSSYWYIARDWPTAAVQALPAEALSSPSMCCMFLGCELLANETGFESIAPVC